MTSARVTDASWDTGLASSSDAAGVWIAVYYHSSWIGPHLFLQPVTVAIHAVKLVGTFSDTLDAPELLYYRGYDDGFF